MPLTAIRPVSGRRLLVFAWMTLLGVMVTVMPATGADLRQSSPHQLGSDFSTVYRTVSPSVVHVHSQIASRDSDISKTSDGSGVVFAPEPALSNGRQYILTSHHVIAQSERTTVRLSDGRELLANLTGSDPKTDLAVIDIPATGLPPVPMADPEQVQIGQWVLAIGSPFGLQHSLTVGVVSGTGRTNIGINHYEDYIQTDAAFSPGNSGGPLVNLDGRMVGIISAVLAGKEGFAGAGFAIPVNIARLVANQLVTDGRVNRAYLGLFLQSPSASVAQALKLPVTHGALISEVAPDSPAATAGLKVGDLIVNYRGEKMRDAGDFINNLSLTTPGSTIEMVVIREGMRLPVTATVAARRAYEQPRPPDAPEPVVRFLGMTVSPLTPKTASAFNLSDRDPRIGTALLITDVDPGSAAALSGIEPGGIVLRIGQHKVSTLEQFSQLTNAASASGQMALLIRQNDIQQFVALETR